MAHVNIVDSHYLWHASSLYEGDAAHFENCWCYMQLKPVFLMPTVKSPESRTGQSFSLALGAAGSTPQYLHTIDSTDLAVSLEGQASDCFHNKDECEDAGSQYSSIAKVKYEDAADPITLCICSGAAFTLDSLAQAVGQVSYVLNGCADQLFCLHLPPRMHLQILLHHSPLTCHMAHNYCLQVHDSTCGS